ncbi:MULTISPECIES: hypothetical protein [unclassified Nodularia (in: cyanobacteria)]|uniref:hypothetical protein n=1 Tax=unclassified Nodularia (in: cyanobacteria) TaxID=2656917 RepID=UPI00187F7D6E|nr:MULTISPECIES: hypothetical protein [unclassified Nodularia (in: cyanobacteria)]MBE9198637.1 hypothetical protein [Nodularia sp. LEGE 06071]MCC2691794.1 hypothetical protein [Nodularia sp. LEGE 04288]
MLKAQQIFTQLCRKLTLVFLASLVWFVTFPTTSVQADGYYSERNHQGAITKPYYISKERQIVVQEEPAKPYYSTKERKKERVIIQTPEIVNGQKVIPKDLETRSRQKNL